MEVLHHLNDWAQYMNRWQTSNFLNPTPTWWSSAAATSIVLNQCTRPIDNNGVACL